MRIPRLLAMSVLGCSASLAAAASADGPDAAKQLFDRGVEALEAGHLGEACPAIEESYKLDPRPGTLFTLAECEAKQGKVASAVKRYDDYLALYAALPADRKKKQGDRETVAREQVAILLPLVPELTLTMPPGAPPETLVLCDGAPVDRAALGTALRVDPGEHAIVVRTPDGATTETRVAIHKGEKTAVLLEMKLSPAIPGATDAPVASPATEPRGSTQRVVAGVVGGAGVASIVVGSVLGVMAKNAWDQVVSQCANPALHTGCAPSDEGKYASAGRMADGSTASFVLGGAAVVTGVVVWLTAPSARPTSGWRITPVVGRCGASASVEGRF
jgi:hypothetical protein